MSVSAPRKRKRHAPSVPRDAHLVTAVLRSMGVRDYEPRVLHQLLEYMQRYTVEVFHEGGEYAEHAGRSQLECEDVHLAIRLRAVASQAGASSFIEWLARERNRVPLPEAPKSAGQLPPQRLCLLKENYQLEPRAAPSDDAPEPPATMSSTPLPAAQRAQTSTKIAITLGAGRGDADGSADDVWE